MFTSAPPGPTLPTSEHGVPSAFTHGGGGAGSAMAIGAAAIEAAATPANKMGVIFVSFTIMRFGYHGRRLTKPLARLTTQRRACVSARRHAATCVHFRHARGSSGT